MNTQSLKYEIIEWITRTDDSSLLKILKVIKDSNVGKDWLDDLDEEETASLQRGMAEHSRGDVLRSEEF